MNALEEVRIREDIALTAILTGLRVVLNYIAQRLANVVEHFVSLP